MDDLVSYAQDSSCAEILLRVMPVYINDQFDAEELFWLSQDGTYSIYCEGTTIFYNESLLVLTDLYDDGEVRYTSQCVRE